MFRGILNHANDPCTHHPITTSHVNSHQDCNQINQHILIWKYTKHAFTNVISQIINTMSLSRLINAASKQSLSQLASRVTRTTTRTSNNLLLFNLQKRALSSGSITYSGGHPNSGQGGYYGSGGARAKAEENSGVDTTQEQRSKMLALASDVEKIQMVMEQLEKLEDLLTADQEDNGGEVTNRSVELRGVLSWWSDLSG
jgi:hypothetical protein